MIMIISVVDSPFVGKEEGKGKGEGGEIGA